MEVKNVFCISCGTAKAYDTATAKSNWKCQRCINKHGKGKRTEIDLGDGVVLKGKDAVKYRRFLRDEHKKEEMLKTGELFNCPACKKRVKAIYRSQGKNKNICTKCSFEFSQDEKLKQVTNNRGVARKMHEAKKKLSAEARKEIENKENNMIEQFLKNKKSEA